MKIRFGYVAIALNLDKVTSSSTLTYSRYLKLNEKERLDKLKSVTYSNIEALEKILLYNIDNKIHFYRITSALIPLATHPEVKWDFMKYFKQDFIHLGKIIKENDLRVDFHPDQFNVLNSDRESVVLNTIESLKFQSSLFDAMNYDEGKLVLHIGGAKGGKDEAIKRFINNLEMLPIKVKNRLIIENDDKTFTALETLNLCRKTNLPMVLDVHHHNCNNDFDNLEEILKEIFDTWNNQLLPPKIHFSSPREFENDKKHSDYIDTDDFIKFLSLARKLNIDFDVMIEAKSKDLALFDLINNLKEKSKKIEFIDNSTIKL